MSEQATGLLESAVPFDQARSLKTGLELLDKKVAEATVEAKEKKAKIYERFRAVHDQNGGTFEEAFTSLRAEQNGLTGADFYERFYHGLDLICRLDPKLQALSLDQRIDALLMAPGSRGPSAENIILIFRAGETAARSRALRSGAASLFLEIYLAQHWNEKPEGTADDPVAKGKNLNYFLIAAELLIGLNDRMMERIEQGMEEKMLSREAAIARLAEKMRILAAEERIAEERAGLRPQDAALVRLGRAVLSAQAELGIGPLAETVFLNDLVSGLDFSGTLGEFLDKALPLTISKNVMVLSRAYHWGRLINLLADLPVELQDHIKSFLLSQPDSESNVNEAIDDLAEPRQRELLALGYECLRENPPTVNNCFDLDDPLHRLISYGKFSRHIRQALDAKDLPSLAPALLLCAGLPDLPHLPASVLSDQAKQQVIRHVLRTAEARDIPALIEAGDAALAILPRRQQPLRTAVAWLIAETVQLLCRDQTSVEHLLQYETPAPSADPSLVELHPVRQVMKQFVLTALVRPSSNQPSVGSNDWPRLFKAEIRQLVVENHAGAALPGGQKAVLALAARLASVGESLHNDRPGEARTELARAQAEAVKNDLKVPRYLVLVGLVYAGILEKVMAGELKELPALLGDPDSPGLSLSAANVSAVLAGEIQTALGKIPGVDDDLTAEAVLLHGLITKKVEHQREAVMAIVSLLKNRRVWDRLLLTVRQQPAEAVRFIDRLLETARSLRVSNEAVGPLRLVRPVHHPQVLHEALTVITAAPPDQLEMTG